MNILIVGNGFDLSHYLPTKYDHFMVAMEAIENWDVSKGEMNFDDLFSALYEKEDYFFGYTKAMYKTDEIKMSVDQIKDLQEQLKDNVWYQYFSDHVKEVKTWIDFEIKIKEALNVLSDFFCDIKKTYDETGDFKGSIVIGKIFTDQKYILTQIKFNILKILEIFEKNNNYGRAANNTYGKDIIAGKFSAQCFIVSGNGSYGFNYSKCMQNLQENLEDFINIFNFYLANIIKCLLTNIEINIKEQNFMHIDRIYSFNYTDTYQRFYGKTEMEFLHGAFGKNQNIVLGVSDLESDSLKILKAYGFTKYHQKLLKATDYNFLNEYVVKTENTLKKISEYEHILTGTSIGTTHGKIISNKLDNFRNDLKLDLDITIWGHSLDSSDEQYIKELFYFNDGDEQNVRITVFYFNKQANFELLTNLIHILTKEKVERWMKNGWLKFEENPDIVKINDIEPITLPKVTSKAS